jgi:anti-sigma factor RsiW
VSVFGRSDDHEWSQLRLSQYVDGDLRTRARRRLERHAADCPDCSRGIRAIKALLRLLPGIEGDEIRAPAGVFDRVRGDGRASGSGSDDRAEE